MPIFFYRLHILLCILLFYHQGSAQFVCEDSVQSYALYSPFKIEHIGGSFVQLKNGYTANTAYVLSGTGRQFGIILTDSNGQFVHAKYLSLTDPNYSIGIANLIEMPGNNILGYGRIVTADGHDKGIAIIKFNKDLSIEWSKLIRRNIAEGETASYDIWGVHCDEQSNIYFSFRSFPGGPIVQPTVFFCFIG